MNDIEATIKSWVASWNEPDPAVRRRVIEATWAPDGIYRNATSEFTGYQGVADAVTAAHQAFSANGYSFRVVRIDRNHDAVRYRWEMVPASGGDADSIGTHVAMVGTDGRFVNDHQFIDKAPSAR